MTLLDLVASLKMDVSQFLSGSRSAKQEMAGLKTEASGLGGQLALTSQDITNANRGLMEVAGNAAAAGVAFSAITAVITGVALEAIELAGSFQQANIGFSTMMGSAQQAQQFLQELRTFAAGSPFEFPELLDASRRLQAMGFEATAVIPIMRTVGDAVAGLGGNAAMIDRITLALGQMQAKGKVSAQEMNQLAEAGIPAWQSLADAIGISIPEAMRRAEQGAISAAEAIPAILEGMQTRFGGMMAAQMTTVAGQWSNFKDQISFILADLGTALLPFAQLVLDAAAPILAALRDMAHGFAELPQPVQGVIVGLGAMAAAIGPILLAFAGVTAAVSAVGTALGVSGLAGIVGALTPILGPLALAIAAAGAAWAAWDNIPEVREAITGLWEVISGFWTDTLRPFIETVAAAGLAFAEFASNIAGSALAAVWEEIKNAGLAVWEVMTSLVSVIAPLWEAFTGLLGALSPLIDPILSLWAGLLKIEAVIVAGGLILAWTALKAVAEGFYFAIREVASAVSTSLVVAFNTMAVSTRQVADVFNNYLKPTIEFVIQKIRDFLGVLVELPGIKQAVEAVGGSFDRMKAAVSGAIGDAKTQIRSWSQETVTSMAAAKTAVGEAQANYDSILKKFQTGKADADDLRNATDRLTRAKRDFKSELDRVKPSINTVIESVVLSRKEYDLAEKEVRRLQVAQRDGKAATDDVVAAQTRLRDAAANVKNSTEAMRVVTAETGVTLNQYSGSIEEVRRTLQAKTTHTITAKEHTEALKAAVDRAREAYRQTYDQWVAGAATEDQLIAKHGELQAAIDRLHPEKVAERQATGHREMMERYDGLLHWFETNIPKLEALNEQLITSNARLANEFAIEHQKIADKAKVPIVIEIKVSERLPTEINAAIQAQQELQEAYRQLGITSNAVYEEKARKAQEAYTRILNSGKSTIGEQLQAEQAYLRAVIEEYRASGQEIPEAIRRRLAEIETDLGQSHARQKTRWETFSADVINIGRNLNRDFTTAVVDLFSGQGWDGFKEAGLNALRAIGETIVELGIDYVKDIFAKNLKDIVTDIIPSIVSAFRTLGSFLLDLFGGIGSAIGNAIGIGTNAAGGAASAAGGAAGAAGTAAGGTASAAGGIVSAASGVVGLVGAIGSVASAVTGVVGIIQGMHQSADLGRIEENTRFTQIALIGSNGILSLMNTHLPKLSGFETFNFSVVAPALAGIESEIVGKGIDTRNEIHSMRDVLIQAKDILHDIFMRSIEQSELIEDQGEYIETAAIASEESLGELQDATEFAAETADSAATMARLIQEIANSTNWTSQILREEIYYHTKETMENISRFVQIKFPDMMNLLADLPERFADGISNLGIVTGITVAIQNLGNSLGAMISNNNPTNAITGAFNQLNQTIAFYGGQQVSSLISIANRPVQQQSPVVNVSVVNTSTSIATQVRQQGFALF